MGIITKPNTFTAGATIIASEFNDNADTIYNEFNGNIDNANIKAGAGIVDTKLAQITTVSKVNGKALTGNATLTNLQLTNVNAVNVSAANATITNLDVTNLEATNATITNFTSSGDSAVKAWINYTGTGTAKILDSYGVNSFVDIATGDYKVNWTTSYSNNFYAVVISSEVEGRLMSINNGQITISHRTGGGASYDPHQATAISMDT